MPTVNLLLATRDNAPPVIFFLYPSWLFAPLFVIMALFVMFEFSILVFNSSELIEKAPPEHNEYGILFELIFIWFELILISFKIIWDVKSLPLWYIAPPSA